MLFITVKSKGIVCFIFPEIILGLFIRGVKGVRVQRHLAMIKLLIAYPFIFQINVRILTDNAGLILIPKQHLQIYYPHPRSIGTIGIRHVENTILQIDTLQNSVNLMFRPQYPKILRFSTRPGNIHTAQT